VASFDRILPAVDRPSKGWLAGGLLLLLLLDLFLLTRLAEAPKILLLAGGIACLVLIIPRLPWAAALLAVGFPLLEPITIISGSDRPVFYLLRLTLIAAIAFFFLARVRNPTESILNLLRSPVTLFAILFGLVLLLGTLWTPSPIYARMKLIFYWATNALLLISGFLIARRHDAEGQTAADDRFDGLLIGIITFSLLLALSGLINLKVQYYRVLDRMVLLGLNPIWVGRIVGLGLLAALAAYRLGRIRTLTFLASAAPLAVVMILAGSRGPLAGLFLVLLIWGFVRARRSIIARLRVLLALAVVGGIALLAMPDVVRDRFLRPMSADLSSYIRLGLLRVIRDAFGEVTALGIGTGGFSHLLRMGDERAYPHNIFAEVVIENGIPGILALLGLIGFAIARGFSHRTDPRTLFAFLAFLFALWNAQFSGDIIGNEWIWLFAGILAGRQR
jgi:O-antigen ligase